MPNIKDAPPQSVQRDLDALNAALDAQIPPKRDQQNLLIASWNIRAFASLTRKWTATGNDSPKRDLRGLRTIIDIVSRFDVVAVQELSGNLRALRDMMSYLGDDWSFLMTDVTAGDAGNRERMAFIFDRRRVQPSGLAAEIVIPPEWIDGTHDDAIGENALREQFARTPYAVSFKAGKQTFILVTLHVKYGDSSRDRVAELTGIARWLRSWADQANRWHHNLLTLGDFNIDRQGDALWQAFTSTGLTVPADLNNVKRTLFSDDDEPNLEKFYDQIAWFESGGNRIKLNLEYVKGGGFDFLPFIYTDTDLTKNGKSFRVSDHYPLWVEFKL